MAIYLKKFENHTQYENYINGSDAILPNVSLTVDNNTVHYNPSSPTPPTPVEAMVVAKFNVTDISSPTKIANRISNFTEIEIDGIAQPSVVSEYTFSTEGEHTVRYTLTDPTSIEDWAFSSCDNLTIDIPNSVTSIGDGAFDGCHFENCTIGNGITSIGDGAFYNNSYLNSVTIMATTPPSICSNYCNFGGEMGMPTIYVPSGSVNTYKTASGWSNYTDNIEPIS